MAPSNLLRAAPRSLRFRELLRAHPDRRLCRADGRLQSHGQDLETALSQVAAEELGIDPARISVRHGDTASTAFGFGIFASRSVEPACQTAESDEFPQKCHNELVYGSG